MKKLLKQALASNIRWFWQRRSMSSQELERLIDLQDTCMKLPGESGIILSTDKKMIKKSKR